ncbi:hypothetical protein ACFQ1Q_04220 [Winogradskyella litorisediminis]|uniref:Aspartyl protease n=1 Tax=Winogradskyella litorisediminis TaxID=1156618 RepID=A0ABW3N887_9FLAO
MKTLPTLLLFFALGISLMANSQDEVLRFGIDTKNTRSKKATYSLVDSKTKDFAFLILDRNQIHANLFNADFKAVSKFTFDAPKRKYLEPLAYSIKDSNYNLLYANGGFSKFIVVTVDFLNKKTTTTEFNFDIDKELYIDTVVHDNNLYLLTSDKTSIIIRTLTENNNLKKVSTFEVNKNSKNNKLYNSRPDFWGYFWLQIRESNITKIDHRIPISIEQASTPNKLYKFKDNLVLSFEDEENGTLVYTIDLNTLFISESSFLYPKGKIDDFKKFNSFIYEDRIFQLASSRKEMSFQIKDLDATILKEFYVTKEDSITFKNGPIVQEGQTYLPFQNRRELEASSKYLRKISSGDIGLSILKNDNLYEIILGGYKQVQSAGFGIGFGGNNLAFNTGTGTFVPIFNPTFYNYNSFSSTKATFFETVLTENFEHVKKEFEPSINDCIDDYMVDYKGITAEDLFFVDETPYYTYINLKKKEFVLVDFRNCNNKN